MGRYRPVGRYGRGEVTKDDLPLINAAKMRGAGLITPDMPSVAVTLSDGVSREIELVVKRFPNGGSWSYFRCPQCRNRAKILRLTEFGLACHVCDGHRYACERRDEPPDARIAKLRYQLYGPGKLKYKRWRTDPEAELRRLLMVKRKRRLAAIANEARRRDRLEIRQTSLAKG